MMKLLPNVEFSTTISGIYYKALYCDTVSMNAFETTTTESICSYCKQNYPENVHIDNRCDECISVSKETTYKSNYNILLKFLKPWYKSKVDT